MNEVANRQSGFNAWDKSVELFVTAVDRQRRCDRGFLYDGIGMFGTSEDSDSHYSSIWIW